MNRSTVKVIGVSMFLLSTWCVCLLEPSFHILSYLAAYLSGVAYVLFFDGGVYTFEDAFRWLNLWV